jgi:hypothetical protein
VNIVVAGADGVGKRSLISRFCEPASCKSSQPPTPSHTQQVVVTEPTETTSGDTKKWTLKSVEQDRMVELDQGGSGCMNDLATSNTRHVRLTLRTVQASRPPIGSADVVSSVKTGDNELGEEAQTKIVAAAQVLQADICDIL